MMRKNALLIAAVAAGLLFAHDAAPRAAAQTVPLVRYQTPEGMTAFAAAPAHRKLFDGHPEAWRNMGAVGHIYATKEPGTLPLFCIKRATQFGEERLYSSDLQDVVAVQKTHPGWQTDDFNKGVVGYVPDGPSAGLTKAAYRYRQPNGKFYLYAFGEGENAALLKSGGAGKFERVAFHVYAQPITAAKKSDFPDPGPKKSNFPDPSPQKPDLSVGNVGVHQNGKVIFAVRNNGFAVNKREFVARLTAYYGNSRVAWTAEKTIAPVIQQGGSSEHSIETPEGKSLAGVRVRVTVDAGGSIEETDEGNNTSDFVDGLPLAVPGPVETRPTPAPASAAPDLRLRQALYANGAETAKVNTAARYAAPDRPLRLRKGDAVSCEGDTCTFNLAFFAQRAAAGPELSTYALLSGQTFGSVGNTVSFAAGAASRDVVLPVRLKAGENRIRIEIDPQRTVAEADEANNSFEVVISVEP